MVQRFITFKQYQDVHIQHCSPTVGFTASSESPPHTHFFSFFCVCVLHLQKLVIIPQKQMPLAKSAKAPPITLDQMVRLVALKSEQLAGQWEQEGHLSL